MKKKKNKKRKLSEELRSIILSKNILKSDGYDLHLNKRTKYYLDFRLLSSYPSEFEKICNAYVEMIKNEVPKADKIIGAALAAVPFGVIVSVKLSLPYLPMQKLEHEESLRSPFSGDLERREQVLMLDDITASGITLLLMADVIRAVGGVVKDAVVLVDRKEGAEELLGEAGIKLHYFLTLQEIVEEII